MATRTHLRDIIRPLLADAKEEGIPLTRENVQAASNIVDVTFSTDVSNKFLTVRFNTKDLDDYEELIKKRILQLTRFFDANFYDLTGEEIGFLEFLSNQSRKMKYYYQDLPHVAYDLESIDLVEFDWLDNGSGCLAEITKKGEQALASLLPHIL